MKKVVVIGSNSFSGSDFIDLLLDKGEYQVVGVSRSLEKDSLFLPYKTKIRENFQFHQIDLNKDLSRFNQIIDTFQPDFIVNFAAQSEVAPSWENPDHWFLTNVVALTNLANLLKDKKYLKKYVHVSSPEVYGTCNKTVTEETPVNPTTPYAASKAAGDLSLFTFYKNFGLPVVLVRATNVYGAYQQLFKIIPRSMIYLKQGKTIELHGGGVAIKSYIHVRDVSLGELLIMEKGTVGEIYHLSPDQGIAVKDVVALICHKMGQSLETATKNVGERLGQDEAYIIDSSKARTQLGWSCSIPFDKGIQQTLDWIENNYEEITKQPLHYIHKE